MLFSVESFRPKMWASSTCNYQKVPEEIVPIGENSPNLVTLILAWVMPFPWVNFSYIFKLKK
jgi:hypothetical protein